MTVFLLAAGAILLYALAYALFCMQKGGVAAALSVLLWWSLDLGLLVLLLYYRTRT